MRKLASIQALRAAAALAVATFHAGQWSRLDFSIGAAGVDVFFVISGFVLWISAERRPVGPGRFLAARLKRIAPLYWLATLVTAGAALLAPQALPIVHPDGRSLVLSLLFLPHSDPEGGPFPLLPTGWTLVYEVFFYAAFALALAGPKDRRLQVLSVILLCASVLGFGYHGWYTLLANPLLLEFLAGVALARLWLRGGFRRLAPAAGPMLLGAGLAALGALQLGGVRDDFLRPFLWGPPAAAIVAGVLKIEADGRLGSGPVQRLLAALGDASYSLYLWQAPAIAAFAWLTPDWPAMARVPASLALAVACGWASWTVLERPMASALGRLARLQIAQRRRRRGFRPSEQEALGAVDPDLA